MKITTKLISILLLNFTAAGFALNNEAPLENKVPVSNSFGYLDIGVGPLPVPIPSFGLGYRNQFEHHGYDISLHASTVIAVTQIKSNFLYHYYFKPNLKSQFYVGSGIGFSGLFSSGSKIENYTACISPEFVFGKEYLNESSDRRFIQVQVSFPTFGFKHFSERNFSDSRTYYMPLVVVSYGIGF